VPRTSTRSRWKGCSTNTPVAASIVDELPDDRWGEAVVAYVQPAGPGLTAAECDKDCIAHPMPVDFKRPRAYRFVDELPRTATGKKTHDRIREEVRRFPTAELITRW